MKFCMDCRFHDDGYGNNCFHPSVMKPDQVHGDVMETCHLARGAAGKCGRDAAFFVQRRGFIDLLGLRAHVGSAPEQKSVSQTVHRGNE